MITLRDVKGTHDGGCLLPFLWLRGEPEENLVQELERIYACGIRQVCLESRPHPDFAGPGWWRDVDVLLREAKARGMKLWILDDDRFPTGHCNGLIHDRYPERARQFLAETHTDVMGLGREAALRLTLPADAKRLGIIACRKPDWESERLSSAGAMDLTPFYSEESGLLLFTLPEGRWRIFTLYTTRQGGSRSDYMNLLDRESVSTLLEAVYEPHYQRYAAEFGRTIQGFFSDEPELGNMPGYEMDATLGCAGTLLPYSDTLLEALRGLWGDALLLNLLSLWYDMEERAPVCRHQMMDAVTRLVYECFSKQLGDWCEARGAQYIGHVIEDAGAHARLGCSIGHYFREMRGQHMAGVDVVHFQVLPGFDDPVHRWIDWEEDGAFFHYGLAKLAASEARLDEKKQGRALCEIFGNYGWAEGVSLMRWLACHMLVRGINRFVPHAFSPAAFPDSECPPHFYARGHNAQYPFIQSLFRAMERVCCLMDGAQPYVDVAVLYHAQSEWTGRDAMPFHVVAKELMCRQIDCDVVPAMDLTRARWNGNTFRIGGGVYRVLILPRCERLPDEVVAFAEEAAAHGVPVVAVDRQSRCCCSGQALPADWQMRTRLCPLAQIAELVESLVPPRLRFSCADRGLRVRHTALDIGELVYLLNENVYREVVTELDVSPYNRYTLYDPWRDESETFAGAVVPLRLLPGQSATILLGLDNEQEVSRPLVRIDERALDDGWLVENDERNVFTLASGQYPNLATSMPFAGDTPVFTYSAAFRFAPQKDRRYWLRLENVGDAARVWLNDRALGSAVGSTRLELTKDLRDGENSLRIEVTGTLFWRIADNVSGNMCVPSVGLSCPPVIESYNGGD